jgi:hypothetical protein
VLFERNICDVQLQPWTQGKHWQFFLGGNPLHLRQTFVLEPSDVHSRWMPGIAKP